MRKNRTIGKGVVTGQFFYGYKLGLKGIVSLIPFAALGLAQEFVNRNEGYLVTVSEWPLTLNAIGGVLTLVPVMTPIVSTRGGMVVEDRTVATPAISGRKRAGRKPAKTANASTTAHA